MDAQTVLEVDTKHIPGKPELCFHRYYNGR